MIRISIRHVVREGLAEHQLVQVRHQQVHRLDEMPVVDCDDPLVIGGDEAQVRVDDPDLRGRPGIVPLDDGREKRGL